MVTIFFIIQVVFFGFTAEAQLEDFGIGPAALPFVYWLCFVFATFPIGLILTFVKGPDGQSIFFNVMLTGQIGGVIGNLIEIAAETATKPPFSFLAITIIVAALYFFAYFRLRSRL